MQRAFLFFQPRQQHRAVLCQPGPAGPVIRADAGQFGIKRRGVVHVAPVAELMRHDAVDDLRRHQHQQAVEIQVPLGRAAPPTGALRPDGDAPVVHAQKRGKRVCIYANGQLQQVGATAFWEQYGKDIALVKKDGSLVLQHYHKYSDIPRYDFALGCLHATPWHERMRSLARQANDLGADAILYDQLGIFSPFACYGKPGTVYEARATDRLFASIDRRSHK